jgi:hypothetical protein
VESLVASFRVLVDGFVQLDRMLGGHARVHEPERRERVEVGRERLRVRARGRERADELLVR